MSRIILRQERRPPRTFFIPAVSDPLGPNFGSQAIPRDGMPRRGLNRHLASNRSVLDLPAALLVELGCAFPWPALVSVVGTGSSGGARQQHGGKSTPSTICLLPATGPSWARQRDKWGLTALFWMALACVASVAALIMILRHRHRRSGSHGAEPRRTGAAFDRSGPIA